MPNDSPDASPPDSPSSDDENPSTDEPETPSQPSNALRRALGALRALLAARDEEETSDAGAEGTSPEASPPSEDPGPESSDRTG